MKEEDPTIFFKDPENPETPQKEEGECQHDWEFIRIDGDQTEYKCKKCGRYRYGDSRGITQP